jgi:hypothetical protein
MLGFLGRLFGRRVAHKAISKIGGERMFDVKFGFALLRHGRVPLRFKLLALGIGAAVMAALIALELPTEAVFAALIIGLPFEAAFDGLEGVIGPFVIASLLLPHLAPADLVNRIRAERAGLGASPVIDVG